MGNKKNTKTSSNTKQYKIEPSRRKKTKNDKEETQKVNAKGSKKKKKHSKLKKVILIFFLLIVLCGLAGVGVFAGIFFSDTWALTANDLIARENTVVYDSDENILATLSASEGDGNRKNVTLDQMGKYTADAYIAIEDKRFYEHS